MIEEWTRKDTLHIEGYRSTTRNYGTARLFAMNAMSEDKEEVILEFTLENKNSRYYFCLDREEYTMYPKEQEVLLQAGLVAKIKSVEFDEEDNLTTFKLYISDKMVEKERRT